MGHPLINPNMGKLGLSAPSDPKGTFHLLHLSCTCVNEISHMHFPAIAKHGHIPQSVLDVELEFCQAVVKPQLERVKVFSALIPLARTRL